MEKKSNLVLIISIVTAILLAVLVGMIVFFNLPAQRIRRMLKTANKFIAEENYDEAILTLQRMLEIDPKNENLYLRLADVYEKNGDIDKEIKLLQEAAEVLPEAVNLSDALEQAYTKVTISERQGTYKDPVSLALDAPEDRKIYYMVTCTGEDNVNSADDSATGNKENEYIEPITLDRNGEYSIEYYAVSKNGYEGEHKTATYVIELDESKYNVNEIDDGAWKQAYIDVINGGQFRYATYFDNESDDYEPYYGSVYESESGGYIDPEAKVWNYTYINEDGIPEITYDGPDNYDTYLLSYIDGEVQGLGGGKWSFISKPGLNLMICYSPRNSDVLKIGAKGFELTQNLYSSRGPEGELYYNDDVEITEDQYESALSQYENDPEMNYPEGKYSTREIIEIINNM